MSQVSSWPASPVMAVVWSNVGLRPQASVHTHACIHTATSSSHGALCLSRSLLLSLSLSHSLSFSCSLSLSLFSSFASVSLVPFHLTLSSPFRSIAAFFLHFNLSLSLFPLLVLFRNQGYPRADAHSVTHNMEQHLFYPIANSYFDDYLSGPWVNARPSPVYKSKQPFCGLADAKSIPHWFIINLPKHHRVEDNA